MRRILPSALALSALLIMLAQAPGETHPNSRSGLIPGMMSPASVAVATLIGSEAVPNAAMPFREGQRVVLVGQITSAPKAVVGVREERKMQVAIGPGKVDYTLHLRDAALFRPNRQKVEPDDLVDREWIRAEGTVMNDPRRIHVTSLQVIGKEMPTRGRSAFYRPGMEQGYIMTVAGSRETYAAPRMRGFTPAALVIVGKVSDDTGPIENTRKIQVDAAGQTWTLEVPSDARVVDAKGEKISVHEIAKGQWIRAHGWQMDNLRAKVDRVENLGLEEAYRASAHFRAGEPTGYVERSTARARTRPSR